MGKTKRMERATFTGPELKVKRSAAGISGAIISAKIGKSRSWFSEIECGYRKPSLEELDRISAAIDQIVETRRQLSKLAADAGLAGIRL